MATRGIKEPYLDFLRELCIEMLSTHGKEPNKRRSVNAAGDARFVKKSLHTTVPVLYSKDQFRNVLI